MQTNSDKSVFAFRWRYVVLPLAMLLLSAVLVGGFYTRLSAEVGYHFKSDGSPDMWLAPGLLAFWALLPQFLLTLGAVAVSWVISMLATRFLEAESAVVSPQRIMLLTGNMVALPQIIILYYLLDVFSYNSSGAHLGLPVLAFALIVMVAGGAVLGVFFVRMMKQVWLSNKK